MAVPLQIVHKTDPGQALLEQTRDFAQNIMVLGSRVLVAVYEPPENARTASGIFLPTKTTEEYKYQGKSALVIGLGPIAFEEDASHRWGDVKPKIGDWVCFNVGDTRGADTKSGRVRFVEDTEVLAILSGPDLVY